MSNNKFLPVANYLKIYSVIAVLLALLAQPAAADGLRPYTAEYQGIYKGINIVLMHQFNRVAKDHYYIKNSAKNTLASFYEDSDFYLPSNAKIKPQRYQYITQYGPIKRTQDVIFDWDKKLVYDKYNKEKAPATLTGPVADRASYQVLLRQLVKSGKRGNISIDLFNNGKLRNYTFTTLAEEVIKTPAGSFKTIPVKRLYDAKDSKSKAQTLWFAKEKDYALVKFSQKDEGELYQITLRKISL